ncbi:MAG: hypothetical protein Unbinned3138contig1000_64 [Prokaryotic dsDNA virus sp.]|nr:MAG: hypothetical protein Unbinned3138contig1000_64 [Prokaryotic dsDNA virus sp.]|tara:strand:- start:1700 stop:1861 length:162 start_codon:yes stop_codon:yes gene_type:complete
MLDEIDEVAFALWTADTGNASRADWIEAVSDHDRYQRMASAAISTIYRLSESE